VRWLGVLLALMPIQVAALSCIQPSVERSFQYASASDDLYAVIAGRLTFNPSDWPIRDKSMNEKPDVDVPARFDGSSL